MPFYASKLPFALEVEALGQTVILNGANVGEELDNPSKNGSPREHRSRVYGFGLTELNGKAAEAFEAWRKEVTLKDGQKVVGGFEAFDNGSILGPFKDAKDAEAECAAVSGIVQTGFEGVDPDAEKDKKTGTKVETRKD